MTTPNSLLLVGSLSGQGSTPGILPGNISTVNTPVNFYIVQDGMVMMPAPVLQPLWSLDNVEYFHFTREDGSIIELTEPDILGGIILIPRVNPDVFIRFDASGNLGGSPNLNAFIG